MALTVTEAIAVNTLLNWLLQRRPLGADVPDARDATEAARLLAAHADKRLHAGIRDGDVPALGGPGLRPRRGAPTSTTT
jgi:hypothetical protein